MIHVIRHLAAITPNVMMVFVHAYPITKEMPIRDVDPNVF